ncbi:MAG TPA: PIN domain-containing protein [Candidatus Acidoferrum sp.]|nr:PIN domain-containing protein [Candidatus Acidoferrum sp.]
MTKLLGLPGVSLPHKARFRRAFDLYVNLNIPFADAYHFTLMADLGLSTIYSFDEDFDRVPGVTRVEP